MVFRVVKHTVHLIAVKALNYAIVLTERQDRFEQSLTCAGLCIKCHACMKICPTGAKYLDDPAFLSHVAMLEQNYTRPTQAEWFL